METNNRNVEEVDWKIASHSFVYLAIIHYQIVNSIEIADGYLEKRSGHLILAEVDALMLWPWIVLWTKCVKYYAERLLIVFF